MLASSKHFIVVVKNIVKSIHSIFYGVHHTWLKTQIKSKEAADINMKISECLILR